MTGTMIRDEISKNASSTVIMDTHLRGMIREMENHKEILDDITFGEIKTMKADLTRIIDYCADIIDLANKLKAKMDNLE